MRTSLKLLKGLLLAAVFSVLSGCDDPQEYCSVGVSSGYSNYGGYHGGRYGYGGSGVRTSISVGGRIR
jgi:hypothetical protein